MLLVFLLFTTVLRFCVGGSESIPPGHMEPLGSHMPPLEVEVLNSFPDPLSFHSKYVQRNLPVKLKGLMKDTDVLKNWQSDEYLRHKFGKEAVGVDGHKKENRTRGDRFETEFSSFLDRYQTEDIYMVSDMPKSMADEWPLPSFLLCGGYTENIAFITIWFSSGGTKSVLHSDQIENLHCVVSGAKTFILIDRNYSEIIGAEHASLGYYNVDVDAVDMNRYPGIAKVPWYKAVIEPGDCLYLPYQWIHQVNSDGRNMGVNIWWIRFQFNEADCSSSHSTEGFASVGQFPVGTGVQVRGFLLEMKRADSTIHAVDVFETQKKRSEDAPVTLEKLIEAFEILKPGCNGLLHETDLTSTKTMLEKYKQFDDFISSSMVEEEEFADQSPVLPIIPPGGPPPEDLGWEAEIVEEGHTPTSTRHTHTSSRDEL